MSIERIEVGRERGVLNKPYGHKILYQQKNHEKKTLVLFDLFVVLRYSQRL